LKLLSIPIYLLFCYNAFSQDVVHQNNIIYGKAANWQSQTEDLKLDLIYLSKAKKLPLIVFMHGGTFLNGSKEHFTKFCEQIAKKGFAVANVEYRQGFDQSPANFESGITQAAYRAQQDEAAATRYLVHHAADYPIDTSVMFIGGESAGGVTSLLLAYVNQNEWDFLAAPLHPLLGAIDNSGNELNDHYSIKGIISLWGGIMDTSLISQQEMQIPVILFHSLNDQVIPYERSSHPEARFQTVHGSLDIAHHFKNNNACYNLYFIKGAKHSFGFSPNYIADAVSDFIKNVSEGKCKSNETENKTGDVNKSLWDY
jgi:predicted peptidase